MNDNIQINNRIQNKLNQQNLKLQNDLKHGLDYVSLMHHLINDSDDNKIIDATNKLSQYKLNTNNINFTNQYHQSDYFSLFMYRFMVINNKNEFDLINNSKLLIKINGSTNSNKFYYKYNSSNQNAYFEDVKYHLSLFSINLEQKHLKFNSHNLIQLFMINGNHKMVAHDIKSELKSLVEFGEMLEEKLNFSIDYSILNTKNRFLYQFVKNELPLYIMDKLFISASKNNYMLTSYQNSGAELILDNNLILKFIDYNKTNHQWGMLIEDLNEQVSWLDVMLKYNFMRQWYLDNINFLEICSIKNLEK